MITDENMTGSIKPYEDDENAEYGVEITGRDAIKLNAEKVLVKTPLLTNAQDVAGAINELFQDGSGNIDTPDADYEKWLALPEPLDNQAVFGIYGNSLSISTGIPWLTDDEGNYYQNQYENGWSVDWGDGNTQIFTNQTSVASHSYNEIGEYTVTFTNICGENTRAVSSSNSLRMIKYGDNVYADRVVGGTTNNTLYAPYLRYVRLSPDTHFSKNFFNADYALRKIEFSGVISELYPSMFAYCYALDFSNLTFGAITEIPNSCFRSCGHLENLKIPVDSVVSVDDYAFSHCYSLRTLKLDNVTSIGDYAFSNCYSLATFSCAEGCTFGNYCFSYCNSLYPKPDGTD